MTLSDRPRQATVDEIRRWIELAEERALHQRMARWRLLKSVLYTDLVEDPGEEWDALAGFLRELL